MTPYLLWDVNELEDYWNKMSPPYASPVGRNVQILSSVLCTWKIYRNVRISECITATCTQGVKSTMLTSSSAAQHPAEVKSSSLSSSVALWILGHHC